MLHRKEALRVLLKAAQRMKERCLTGWLRSTAPRRGSLGSDCAQCRASGEGARQQQQITAQIFLPRVKRREIVCKEQHYLFFLSFFLFIFQWISLLEKSSFTMLWKLSRSMALCITSLRLPRGEWWKLCLISSLIFESLFHFKKCIFFLKNASPFFA